MFATLVRYDDQIFKLDSKWTPRNEKKAMKGSFGEDIVSERIG